MSGSSSDSPLAVIVISFAGPPLVERCLRALSLQTTGPDTEVVIVVGGWQHRSGDLAALQAEFAEFRWILAPRDHNVARMRTLGIAESAGDPLIFLEDDCVPDGSWLSRLRAAAQAPWGALGGSIEPGGYRRSLDWAAYFSEYGPFMAPLDDGVPSALPGTNVAYRRHVLAKALPTSGQGASDGFYETFIHQAITSSAHLLQTESGLVVRNVSTWAPRRALAVRFHHGRGYAGLRTRGFTWWRRAPYVGLAVLLPAVLVWRTAATLARKRRFVFQALRAAPWIVLMSCAWSAGEFVGYLAGPGRSLDRWR